MADWLACADIQVSGNLLAASQNLLQFPAGRGRFFASLSQIREGLLPFYSCRLRAKATPEDREF